MSESETDPRPAPDAPIEQKSRWEDYLDVFFAPADLFRRRAHDKLAPPLITLLLLGTAFYYIMLPSQAIIFRAAMPPEAQAKMPGNMMLIMQIAGGIGVPITYLLGIVITAGVMWLLARLVDAKPEYREMMIVATYAAYIGLLAQIATSLAIMVHGEENFELLRHTSFGILRFVDPKTLPKALVALVAQIDLFKIWHTVVLAIGFQIVTGVSRGKAALVAIVTWLLFALPGILGGGMAGKMGATGIETKVE